MMMSKVWNYCVTTWQIARVHDVSVLIVFWRAMVARLRYNIGIDFFNLYQLTSQDTCRYAEYLPQVELERKLKVLSSDDQKTLYVDKILFYLACKAHQLPTPSIIGYLPVTGTMAEYDGVEAIESAQHFEQLMSQSGLHSFIFKPAVGGHGDGVLRISWADGVLRDDTGTAIDTARFLDEFRNASTPHLLQPALRPHPDLKPIMPRDGLGTVRVVTLNDEPDVRVGYACLKLPVGSAVVDNFTDGRNGNLVAQLDLTSGEILAACGASETYPNIIEGKQQHPDSQQQLIGFVCPHYREILELAVHAARTLGGVPSIGWDIALTEDGACLIEGNWKYGGEILQCAMQRGLRTDLLTDLSRLTPRS